MLRRLLLAASFASALVAMLLPPAAMAQGYPSRPIRMIVPYSPGDAPDVLARLVGAQLSERLGQAVVIENKPGASGQIGINQVAKAAPDGYTLGVGLVTNLALAPYTFKSLPYDPLRDLAPVALGATNYFALVARPDAPYKNVAELIQWAKDHPGQLRIGTTSQGGHPHMSFELLAQMAGFRFTNVPYKAGGAVTQELLGGLLDLGVVAYTSVAGMVDSGKLRVLGISPAERDPKLPNVPTVGETVKGYAMSGWFGFVAPAGTPPDVIAKLNAEINRALALPDVQKAMANVGLTPSPATSEQFGQLIQRDNKRFAKLVKDVGYQPE